MHRLRASLYIVQRRKPGHGMNFSRAPRKAAATVDRRFEIVCHEWTTPGQWVSMSFIFHPFTRLDIQIAKVAIIQSSPNLVIQVCRGQLAAKQADTKQSSPHSARWPILTGFKSKSENAEWKSRSTSQSIAHLIILTSKSIQIGSTSAQTAPKSTPRTRRRNMKTSIH